MDTQLNIRLRVFCLATAVASLTAIACDYPVEPVGKEEIGIGIAGTGGGPATGSLAIEGTWQRTIETIDEFGFLNVEQTTWVFEPDGDAIETIITANANVADTVVMIGRWRVVVTNTGVSVTPTPTVAPDTSLVVDFTTPPGQVILDARVSPSGNVLVLGGQEFLRVE